MAKAGKKKRLQKPLRSSITKELSAPSESQDRSLDSLDQDLLSYVSYFLCEISNIAKLKKLDFSSPESSLRASEYLSETKLNLEKHLRTARILQNLLEKERTN